MAVRDFFNISIEEDEIKEDLGGDAVINATDDTAECKESECSIQKDITTLESNIAAVEKLEEIKQRNEEVINDQPSNDIVTADALQASQEALLTTLASLGYSSKDLKALRISSEYRVSPYEALVISQEGIIDSIKTIIAGIIELFTSIGKHIKKYLLRFIRWIMNKRRLLETMLVYTRNHSSDKLPQLESNVINKISGLNASYLRVQGGSLDIKEIIDFYTNIDKDPFINDIEKFLEIVTKPPKEVQTLTNNLLKNIQSADKSKLQKDLQELVKNNSDTEPIYVLAVNGGTITYYGYNDKSKTGLGFNLIKTNIEYNGKFIGIKGANTIGDLTEHIQSLLNSVNSAKAYGERIESVNNLAEKTMKQFESKLSKSSIEDRLQMGIVTEALKIVKEIGSKSLVTLIQNYAVNNRNLTKTIEYYINPLIKQEKKVNKEKNK